MAAALFILGARMATAELVQTNVTMALPRAGRRWPWVVAVLVAMALAIVAGLVVGGEPARFARMGLVFAPGIVLVGLLQARGSRVARVLSWMWFWLLMGGIAVSVVGLTQAASEASESTVATVSAIVFGIMLVGVALTATSTWRTLGQWLGGRVERGQAAHAQGTLGLIVGSALAFAPLVVLGGRAPLTGLIGSMEAEIASGGAFGQLAEQVAMLAWTVVFVVWACAWPSRTTLAGVARRLGLGRLRRTDVPWLAALTLVALGVGIGGDFITGGALDVLGWPRTDAELLTRLMPAAKLPVGALVVAVCAGVSEELIVRGLLQPRFGWLLANVGFVAAHALQYGLDGLAVVFCGGALLAFVRWRWNTTAAIAVHTSYDLILLGFGAVSS